MIYGLKFSDKNSVVRRRVSLRENRVCPGVEGELTLPSVSVTIFLRVLASVELLKDGGGFTTLSKVPVPSDT